MMAASTLRQVRSWIRSQWRVRLVLALSVMLATTCVSAIVVHLHAASTKELRGALAHSTSSERTLLIEGDRYAFGQPLYDDLLSTLGSSLDERIVIRRALLAADPASVSYGGKEDPAMAIVDLQAIDQMDARLRVVEGKLPQQVNMSDAVGNWPPPMEVAIGRQTVDRMGLAVGDRVTANGLFHRLDIVGIVEPADDEADIWGGDLRVFGACSDEQEPSCDLHAIPLLIAPKSMQAYLAGPIFNFDVSWRIAVSHDQLEVPEAARLQDALVSFQARSAAQGAQTATGLLRLLDLALARISGIRIMIMWLLVQATLVALITLIPVVSLALDRGLDDMARYLDRGVSISSALRTAALGEAVLLISAGLVLGPVLGLFASAVWNALSGAPSMLALPGEAWALSAIITGMCWIISLTPLAIAARRRSQGRLLQRACRPAVPPIHRRFLDVYLLAFAALLTWQLQQSGSILMDQLGNTEIADPLLLFAPSLLILGLAAVLLRVFPLLATFVARACRRRKGWLGLLAFARLAWQPGRASGSLLSLAFTAGVALAVPSLLRVLRLLRPDPLAQGAISTLLIGCLLLAILSGVSFALVRWLESRGRRRNAMVLSSLGVSQAQRRAESLVRSVAIVVPAVILGLGLGVCLIRLAVPQLTGALSESHSELSELLTVLAQALPTQWTEPYPVPWASVLLVCAGLFVLFICCALIASLLGSPSSQLEKRV